jgi:hypothetical protein
MTRNNEHDQMWDLLTERAGWQHHCFADGSLAHILMHVVTDPAALLRGDENGTARASVRLVLRDGHIFGLVASAPRSRMLDVLQVANSTLGG